MAAALGGRAVFLTALCVVAQLLVCGRAQMCTPDVLSQYVESGWPTLLDVGVYWFGPQNQFVKAKKPSEETKQQFYDPRKPTVIYFHGWTGGHKGWVLSCKRETTKCPPDVCGVNTNTDPNTLLADAWLSQGWNVGFFYWDQLADEECARDAEQKIWFDKGGNGLRWRSYDVAAQQAKWVQLEDEAKSVGTLAANKVREAMGEYKGKHVRFVGHDLGAQLAVQCAAELHLNGDSMAPQRIAMLEPVFTEHHFNMMRCTVDVKSIIPSIDDIKRQGTQIKTGEGLGSFAADNTASVVQRLWQESRVVTEIYKSSELTQNDRLNNPNVDLSKLGTLVIYKPTWCGTETGAVSTVIGLAGMPTTTENSCYHAAMFALYFLHFGLMPSALNPAPPTVTASVTSALRACPTPSASCGDDQLREWVDRQNVTHVAGGQRWTQATGMDTFNMSDDSFTLMPPLSGTSEVVEVDAGQKFAYLSADKPGFMVAIPGMEKKVRVPVDRWVIIAIVSACSLACFGGALCMCAQMLMSNKVAEESEYDESGMSSGGEEDEKKAARGAGGKDSTSFKSCSDVDSATPLKDSFNRSQP
jgi:hypothetical protein